MELGNYITGVNSALQAEKMSSVSFQVIDNDPRVLVSTYINFCASPKKMRYS